VRRTDSALIQLGDGRIKDMKFADDNVLLVLWESNGKKLRNRSSAYPHSNTETRSLLSLFYGANQAGLETPHLKYSSYMQNGGPYSPTIFSNENVKTQLSRFQIPDPGSFIPERMEFRGQDQRRQKEGTRRLMFLRDDKMHYKVFKFTETTGASGDIPMS
jgi:anaphase-promoting complex subunit 4